MMNMQALMKQAQAMQKKMEETQAKLESEEFEGASGGGMVKVLVSGKFVMKKVTVDKSLMTPDEADILEDLIVAAFNDAKGKIDKKMAESMSGFNIPGMKLPF